MLNKNPARWPHHSTIRLLALCSGAASLLLLYGCSSEKHSGHASQDAMLSHMIYSPNGEPLNGGPLGRPTCQVALSGWFGRVDRNHDNRISSQEFMNDARAQFLRMDIDGNGYLVPEELERFRRPYRQEAIAGQPARNQDNGNTEIRSRHGRRDGSRHGDNGSEDNQSSDTVDPVMAADTNLDFEVTPQEFTLHAEKVFTALDSNHDGALSRDEVLSQCGQKP